MLPFSSKSHNYYNQQLKPGASYPVSSPQNLQAAASPQISHQSSPQIVKAPMQSASSPLVVTPSTPFALSLITVDSEKPIRYPVSSPQNLHRLYPVSSPQNLQAAASPQISHQSSPQIVKAPMQSANSPLVITPSTPFAPSPIAVDSEKPIPAISSVRHAGQQQTLVAQPQLAVTTPGISASPLLAECISQDGNQVILAAPKTIERPIDRLIKMVQSLTPKSLSSSLSDIASVVSMVDRITGSVPGNGSRTAVGEDLAAMIKCRLQARNFISQDGGPISKKMKHHTSAMPLKNASEGFKRLKPEPNYALLEEIMEINHKLSDTVVDVSDEEEACSVVVTCSYTAVAISPDLKAQFSSAPIMPMRLLVCANYPDCSPMMLDDYPVEPRGIEDLSSKAKVKFGMSLWCLSQPILLGEMVRTWDACARRVVLEYAMQAGGGSFSSTYGSGNIVWVLD